MLIKVEKDETSAPELIPYEGTSGEDTENHSTESDGRLLDELVLLRAKYNETFFELRKAMDTVKSLESAKVAIDDRCKQKETLLVSMEADNKKLSEQLLNSTSTIASLQQEIIDANDQIKTLQTAQKTMVEENSALLRASKSKGAEMNEAKQQNRVLRARIEQIQQVKSKANRNDDGLFNVEKILNHKLIKKTRFFFVRWEGYESSDDSWVKESQMHCKDLIETYLKDKNLK